MLSRKLKLAASGALLAACAFSGMAARADTALPIDGNSNWVLFVRNPDTNQTYARSLTLTVDSVLTTSQIASGPYTGPGHLISPTNQNPLFPSNQLAADANLSTFIGSCTSCVWSIMAGDNTPLAPDPVGSQRYVLTSPFDLAPSWFSGNGDLTLSYSQINNFFADLNGNLPGAVGADSSIPSGGLWGTAGTTGEGAQSWFGAGYYDNLIGDSAYLYLVTTSGGGTGDQARLYQAAMISMDANGNLILTPNPGTEIPLPAAAWLLLSGLAGLAGVGRRRGATA